MLGLSWKDKTRACLSAGRHSWLFRPNTPSNCPPPPPPRSRMYPANGLGCDELCLTQRELPFAAVALRAAWIQSPFFLARSASVRRSASTCCCKQTAEIPSCYLWTFVTYDSGDVYYGSVSRRTAGAKSRFSALLKKRGARFCIMHCSSLFEITFALG